MINKGLLNVLTCPQDHTPLVLADSSLIAKLNRAIASGQITNRMGQKLDRPIDGGLVRSDHQWLYPIIDDIPIMLIDEAIPLNQIVE